MKNKNVVVLGASSKKDKYSYQAVELLSEYGYNVFPVHPSGIEVSGHKTYKNLNDINEKIDTISVYLSAKISNTLTDEIFKLSPRRIIFNPGAENPNLTNICNNEGIEVENACTLVLLRTNSFE